MSNPPRVLSLPGGEPILHHGPSDGLQFLVLQPLFEEMNCCRAFVARLCRGLAAHGYGCWLPDLPGCGESARALETVRWSDWLDAVMELDRLLAVETGQAPYGTISIRGGALLDSAGMRRWRLSPVSGASLVTDLRRSGLSASGAYPLTDDLADALGQAEPDGSAGARTLRLLGDDRAADRHVDGPALWRRPEPIDDPVFAATLVGDIVASMRP